MKPFVKSAMALGVAGALTLAAATPSLARSRHWGPALGAGFVAGALIGAAAADANARYYYGEPYGYEQPTYVTPGYDAYGYAPRSYRGYSPGDSPSFDRERVLRGTDY